MKKMLFALMTMLTVSISVKAMSYEQARNEALFLTDKMAYELNLVAVERLCCSHLFLSSTLLGCRLLALRHLCPLPTS